VLGAVVTNAALPRLHQPVSDQCGSCRRCLDGCPTQAIVAPGVVDARRCLAWLLQQPGSFPLEYRSALDDRIYGCDDCQEVCPPSRREESRSGGGPTTTWLDALALLELDDDGLLEHCGRWYLPGRDVNVVRRNLLIVVGNRAGPSDSVRAVLDRYRRSSDPILAEHAAWALDQVEDPCRPVVDGDGDVEVGVSAPPAQPTPQPNSPRQ
jgi:epoxyqueuosine reductase